jgi:D-alanyl-D-alanine carboxypeptidase (penicillin-binding protein 5/6)
MTRAGAILLALLLAGVAPGMARGAAPSDAYPDIARAYWVEIDNQPIWAGRPDERLPMASLTKLMTALLVAETADLDAVVTVDAAVASETGTRIGLRPGERVQARDLFTAMLVRSANDACRALADWQGGNQARFVARMNARAVALGLRDTHYNDACGHDGPGQYSSVRDLATLAHAALGQPAILAAAAQRDFRFRSVDGRVHAMHSTNALLGIVPGTKGLKTGYTPGAGRCLVALAERDGVRVLAVLLHAPDRWWDSAGLLELAFARARQPRP